jgi:hypothetical protein
MPTNTNSIHLVQTRPRASDYAYQIATIIAALLLILSAAA